MSISKFASAVGYGAILVVSALASIAAAEGVFRLLGDEPSPDFYGLYAPFRGGNYKLGSKVDTEALLASGRVSVHTDSLGLRTDDARQFATKPGDTVDFLILGDSQGFGNGVNFEKTIAGSLAVHAARAGYHVANASVGGHSLASQIEMARWLVDQEKVHVKSFLLFVTPAMIEGCDRLNQAAVGDDGRIYGAPPDWKTRLLLWAKTRAVVYLRVRDAVRNYGIGANPAKRSSSVFDFYKNGPEHEATRERFRACLQELAQFVRGHRATLHVIYIPLTVEADFEPVRQAAAQTGANLDSDLPLALCTSTAQHLDIPVHSLKPVLRQVQAQGHPLNVKGDFHYSDTLSEASGKSIWAFLDLPDRKQSTTNPRTEWN